MAPPPTAAEIEKIQSAEKALEAQTAATKAELRRRREALCGARQPFMDMLQRRRNLNHLIAINRPRLAELHNQASALREWLRAAFLTGDGEAPGNWVAGLLSGTLAVRPAQTLAPQIIPVLTDWLSERCAELAALESAIVEFAHTNGLAEDLPAELQARDHATAPTGE